ncbi:protein EPIDERMAL PATTERNING FACTOR 2 isoform X2 [Jatropha curcas]|uniref:protein EPIDERMAL PATTERNING FACTOR 2 isoform X2 n=1 Tax=Jatropha curcas TaxID=180498 RepID=UPI0009D77FA8|nr:protein EPIDERMAL PATTERNING FACTOR 2 isoform X2 [Jatropha curcas]
MWNMKLLFGAHKSFLLLLIFMALFVDISISLHKKIASKGDENRVYVKEEEMEVYPTGSSLPDCSHACGPCFPCKRVMVSFKCSIGESCPIVYRCMCKGKYYHVPSA